uniref:flavin reductase family protein n=1 Tax=Thaumasiovibrio subtropicus TaxID=1891207 RepID=UPI000B34E420|nr:flavin reductase [Thaumasiovibrio subtropicus]
MTAATLEQFEQRYRARFINSLSGFKSANLIGTCDDKGQTNLAIVSSVFHLGANPPLMGFISRPPTAGNASHVERHTLSNLIESGFFTLNSVSIPMTKAAHQTSARYPQTTSEFDVTGLTAAFLNRFPAPFVEESPIKIGLEVREHHHLSINNTVLIIGEIKEVHLPTAAIQPDGFVDIEDLGLVTISGLDSYHLTERMMRLSYAKPDKPLDMLSLQGSRIDASLS